MWNVGPARGAFAWVAAAAFGLAGCASEVGQGDPAPAASTAVTSAATVTTESHRKKPEDDTCSPLTCCFPSQGGGWQDEALQNRLQALGCSTPSPYEQTSDGFWEWSECPFNLSVVAAVFKYSASPDSAHFVENPCLPIHLGKAQVVFDPVCPSCTADTPPVITLPPVIALPPITTTTTISL